MPPKKTPETEKLNLPPLNAIQVKTYFNGKLEHKNLFFEKISQVDDPLSISVSKDKLENLAKEYQFYINPDELTDKQKKDPKFQDIPTELDNDVLFKTLSQYIQLESEELKKIKKAKQEGKEYKAAPTKDSKGKKDPKQPIAEETKKLSLNLEPNNDIDMIFMFSEFPNSLLEIEKFFQTNSLDILLFLEEDYEPPKFISDYDSILNSQTQDFDNLRENANLFEPASNIAKENKRLAYEYSAEDIESMNEISEIREKLMNMRKSSQINAAIRNTVILTKKVKISNLITEQEMESIIFDLYSDIISLYSDLSNYQDWLKNTSNFAITYFGKEDLNMEPLQESQMMETSKRKDTSNEESMMMRRSSRMKTNMSMETSFDMKGSSVNKQQAQMLFFYNRQLSTLAEDQIGPEILLEALLDQIVFDNEKKIGLSLGNDIDSGEDEEELLDDIFQKGKADLSVKFNSIKPSNGILKATDPNFPAKLINIITEDDFVAKTLKSSNLFSLQTCSKKAKSAFNKNIQVPGCCRYLMPREEDVDFKKLRSNQSMLYSFCQNINLTEYKRRQRIISFEELMNEKVPRVQWNFSNRVYVEGLAIEDFKKRYFEYLEHCPTNIEVKYNELEDNLFVAIYWHSPPGRELRQQWKYPFKCLPSAENWINFFKGNPDNLDNVNFYDVDNFSGGKISSRTKFMYPNDGAILKCEQFNIGEQTFYRNQVIKDGMVFGLKNKIPFSEFSLNYSNNTKLFAEIETMMNGNTFLSSTLSFRNGLIVKFLPKNEVLQVISSGSHREQKRIFDDIASNRDEKFNLSEIEVSRVITEKGMVERHMKDGSMQILFPNGNILINHRSGNRIRINNKGNKVMKKAKDGSILLQGKLKVSLKTDYSTGSKVLIREDNVIVTFYKDGSVLTKHRDGTTIFRNKSRSELIVQKEGFAAVKFRKDEVKARMKTVIGESSSFASIGFQDLMERSYNGIVCEVYYPDNTIARRFLEMRELQGYNNYIEQFITLYFHEDGSVVKAQENGEIVVVSPLDRVKLEDEMNEKEYFLQLFLSVEDRIEGIYTCDLLNDLISTKDSEGNIFEMKSNNDNFAQISISFNVNSSGKRPASPQFAGKDFIREDSKFLPQPIISPPKLFVVEKDNVIEFLEEKQLKYYFTSQSKKSLFTMESEKSKIGEIDIENISLFTRIQPSSSKNLINAPIPKCITPIPQLKVEKDSPDVEFISVRRLKKYSPLTESDREQVKRVNKEYEAFRTALQKKKENLYVIQKDEGDLEREFILQMEIYERRKKEMASSNSLYEFES